VSLLLRKKGYAVIDADELAREVVQKGTPAYSQIVAAFGPEAVLANGELNRAKIGEVVFRDRSRLAELERITHPLVRALAATRRSELEFKGEGVAFYDVPLLFEKKMKPMFDRVVAVVCSPEIQRQRLMKRNHFSAEEAERRIQAQIPIGKKTLLADDVIANNGSLLDLEHELDGYLKKLHQAQT
jgi:dephospho-CoA kinase